MTFPGIETGPWRPTGGWHIDGRGEMHVTTPSVGVVPLMLFTDIAEHEGGTALIPGSHLAIARVLANAEPEGIQSADLTTIVRDMYSSISSEQCVEAYGSAGDVFLMHPLLVHSRSVHLCDTVRVIANPNIFLTRTRCCLHCLLSTTPQGEDPIEVPPVDKAIIKAIAKSKSRRDVCHELDNTSIQLEAPCGHSISLSDLRKIGSYLGWR